MSSHDALLIGENSIHLFDEKVPLLEATLGDDVAADVTTDFAALEDLSGYDLVVDYVTDSSLSEAQIEGLCSFVVDGGGYLPIHCASDLTSYFDGEGNFTSRKEPVPELRELVRGHFLSHPEVSTFGVEIVDDHPVVEGVSDFEINDEPYQVDCDEDEVRVLARMNHEDLEEAYPMVWAHEYGEGRVCYSSLGHTDEALAHEAHRRILENAVEWVADA